MLRYGLVLALFLLGPGFATYAGIFYSLRGGRFQAAPPPPNSIFSLALVGMAALAWHTGCSVALALNDDLCRHVPVCLAVPFEPDIYAAALRTGSKGDPGFSPEEVAAFLLTCSGLSVVAFVTSSVAARAEVVIRLLRQPLYGLYAGLVGEAARAAATPGRAYVTAYVVTDMEKDGAYLGYFGVLENLQIGADKQVAGVALLEVGAFLLRMGRTVHRTPDLREDSIERMLISGARIQNIAFELVQQG